MFDLRDYVLNGIWCKIDDGESFTAHDITRGIRDLVGRSEHIEHADVRAIVHEVMLTDLDDRIVACRRSIDRTLPGRPWRYLPPAPVVVPTPVVKMTRDESLALGRPLGGMAVIDKEPPDVCARCGEDMDGKSWHQYLAHLSNHARGIV